MNETARFHGFMEVVVSSLGWHLLILVCLFMAVGVQASPFLVSDPWPSGGPQPDTCIAQEGSVTKDLKLEANETGSKYVHQDMSAVTGTHHWIIACANAWGAAPLYDFPPFVAGSPTGPSGLRLAP